jgi:hypothetical protein
MMILRSTASDEEIREVARYWVDLLGHGRFAEAAEMLLPELIANNGSVSEKEHSHWTAQLIEEVLHYGGNPFPYDGQVDFYKVVPVEDALRADFESRMTVERGPYLMDARPYLGDINVDLPWECETGNCIGDITARLRLRDLGDGQMALVLEDMHVM